VAAHDEQALSLSAAVERLEAAARGRFVRWDPTLWRELVRGPATDLAAGLDAAGAGVAAVPLVESYLRLVCEAVGLGYLFPASAGRESFFNLAFRTLAPVLLPRLPAYERARALAGMWNLAENLESAPVWLARIFYRAAWGWRTLASLEGVVAEVARLALSEPESRLGAAPRVVWMNLGDEDRRFLPGGAHFVAPTVVCVHDRARAGVSLGVWLVDEPLSLGPMGCAATPAPAAWSRAVSDVRFDEPLGGVENVWRAAATLVTSQQIVALLP
jgi:hypothetical protein